MLKRRALMDSISSNLHGFLKKIANNLPVPDKKFLRDSIIGLIRSGKPIVCQMVRRLHNPLSAVRAGTTGPPACH